MDATPTGDADVSLWPFCDRLARAAVRCIAARVPASLSRELLAAAVRRLQATGEDFVTLDFPGKTGDAVRYRLTDPIAAEPAGRIGVVVQGPVVVEDDFTVESIRYYRRLCPEFLVILSTWEGELAAALDRCREAGAEVVLSRKPAVAGRYNVNLQAASSAAGIGHAAAAGCRYVAKTRTDQRLYALHALYGLPGLLEAFPPAAGTGQVARLVITSFGTHKYTPFNVSDFFMFGSAADMMRYWSSPADECNADRAELDSRQRAAKTVDEYARMSPERYLVLSYLFSAGSEPARTIRNWWAALADRFVILDWGHLNAHWPKYHPHAARPDLVVGGSVLAAVPMTMGDWLSLHGTPADRWCPPEHILALNPWLPPPVRLEELPTPEPGGRATG